MTLFKVPDESNIEAALAKYATLKQDALKNNSPYILSVNASKTYSDPRNQGFTICARTIFASIEDMQYYDTECAAHQGIKEALKGKVSQPGGVLMVYMDADKEKLGL